MGLNWKLPPQLGHTLASRDNAQVSQNVHSKLQIIASRASGGSAFAQYSQVGRRASIGISFFSFYARPSNYVSTPHMTSVNASPTTDTMVCNTDQTNTVCFSCKPKYSRIIQKPASLTWQKNTEPAPIASAINEL